MAGHILAFPTQHNSAAGIPALRGALALANVARNPGARSMGARAPEKPLGPMLVYTRPRTSKNNAHMTQAEHLNALLQDEIAERVQRQAAERRAGGRIVMLGKHRSSGAALPAQATMVRFRDRVLDALSFLVRRP